MFEHRIAAHDRGIRHQSAQPLRSREGRRSLSSTGSSKDSEAGRSRDVPNGPLAGTPEPLVQHHFSGVQIHAGGRKDATERRATAGALRSRYEADDHAGMISIIRARQGSGEALPGSLATSAGGQLGADPCGVRIHRDAFAQTAAASLDANAFTVGQDIFFAPGMYAPEQPIGRHRLHHELAHTMQQQRQSVDSPGKVPYLESRAELAASSPEVHHPGVSGLLVMREPRASHTGATTPTRSQRSAAPRKAAIAERGDPGLGGHVGSPAHHSYWRDTFEALIASRTAAVHRVVAALQKAQKNYEHAKATQRASDAAQLALMGALFGVVTGGYGWLVSAGLVAEIDGLKKVIEIASKTKELAASVREVGEQIGTLRGEGTTEKASPEQGPASEGPAGLAAIGGGGPVSLGDDPFVLMNERLESIESLKHTFFAFEKDEEGADISRTPQEWRRYDPGPLNAQYAAICQTIEHTMPLGIKSLKSEEEMAKVLERHIWARWIVARRQEIIEQAIRASRARAAAEQVEMILYTPYRVGSDIEVAMNDAGVATAAKVKLSGSIFASNSPEDPHERRDWRTVLLDWARAVVDGVPGYSETIEDPASGGKSH